MPAHPSSLKAAQNFPHQVSCRHGKLGESGIAWYLESACDLHYAWIESFHYEIIQQFLLFQQVHDEKVIDQPSREREFEPFRRRLHFRVEDDRRR